jgi:soluble lytic murein transglycosylase-like protein
VRRPRRLILLAALVLVLVAAVAALSRRDSGLSGHLPSVPTPPGATSDRERTPLPDPFAYDPARRREFEQRAAAGTAHVLYARSPGGAQASALRTARWRPQIEAAAKQAGVDPNRLEALVFLESAGRPDAMAGDTEGAVGLTQILAETAQNLLGMWVDVARSRRYTRRIRRALVRGKLFQIRRLEAARARVDQRFDPAKSLQATARYLTMAKARFKREDLAFVSYHMGMGNLESVLHAYGAADVPYAQVYFDSSPIRHSAAYAKLSSFGDDSSNYLWKLGAAERIMQLSREDIPELARLEAAQTAKASAEEVLHPLASTPQFTTPALLRRAWADEQLVAFPDDERVTGLRADPRMGELAPRIGQTRSLYEGLRPEALATALYIGAEVRALSGRSPLVVTSTVRDDAYQKQLVARNREATRNYSLHTTGWAFDIARQYRSKAQALAFQFVLDRLQVLDAIAWAREPDAIHITAAPEGKALLPLLKRVQPGG